MTESREMFVQLVLMFQMNAMQGMGKLKNPLTDQVERSLEAAQFSIDLLDMLREKTKGNLSQTEERLLTQVLQDLKLNFVEEVSKKESPAEHPRAASVSEEGGETPGGKDPADGGPGGQEEPGPPEHGAREGGPTEGKPS